MGSVRKDGGRGPDPVRPVVAAVATPPGGALGVVRLTGAASWDVADRVFAPSGRSRPRRMVYGRATDSGGRLLDRCCAVYYEAPYSYTGERMVEIFCHGGRAVLSGVAEALVSAGAVPAEPGEFTRRAFENGKMTLLEAEAVAELSTADDPELLRAGLDQLEGGLDARLSSLEERLDGLWSRLEGCLQFPEDEPGMAAEEGLGAEAERLAEDVRLLLERVRRGRMLRHGPRVVLAGMTNAGKSSLFNRLCGWGRVLVSEERGTTRDAVEERVVLGGRTVVLCDTAGFGEGGTEADREARRQATERVRSAALVLLVRDRSVPLTEEARHMEASIRASAREVLLVHNKSDLPAAVTGEAGVEVSARTGEGMENLIEAILEGLDGTMAGDVVLGSERVERGLVLLWEGLGRVVSGLKDHGYLDIVAEEAAKAKEVLERLRGAGAGADVLDGVFARFCIGK